MPLTILMLLFLAVLGFFLWRFFLRHGTTDRMLDTSPRRKTAKQLLRRQQESKQQLQNRVNENNQTLEKLEKENTNLNEY